MLFSFKINILQGVLPTFCSGRGDVSPDTPETPCDDSALHAVCLVGFGRLNQLFCVLVHINGGNGAECLQQANKFKQKGSGGFWVWIKFAWSDI